MSITTITLENTSANQQANAPITFGQVFAKGHLPTSGAALELNAPNDVVIPCQVDIKSTHNDGSVKHCLVSAIIPLLPASAQIIYGLGKAAAAPAGAAATPADFPGLKVIATITDTGTNIEGPTTGTVYTANAAAFLASGNYMTWLSGPIVSEWIVRVPLITASGAEHPDVHARFSIRAYKGQARAKIDYVLENNWAKPNPTPSIYDVWNVVSNTPKIYSYILKAGEAVVDTRSINGNLIIRTTAQTSGAFEGLTTHVPNNNTLYQCKIEVDGVEKNISLLGSSIQTFGQLYSAINTQLSGMATCFAAVTTSGIRITSLTSGPGSQVKMLDYGSLLPAITATGLANNSTVYTATITIGDTVKNIAITGSTARSFAQLCAQLNTQLAGLAIASPQQAAPGVKITPTTTGASVIIDEGTLFAITKTKLFSPTRPIRGDEVVHHPGARWKKTFWWGTEPTVHIRHDKAYLVASCAVPNYDPNLIGDPEKIANRLAQMKANEDIGSNGITKAGMPGPGASPGIGILPEWAAMYFVNQGADAKYTMLKQADLQGSWPVHYREYDTDAPLDISKWPYATILQAGASASRNPITGFREVLPRPSTPVWVPSGDMSPDVAHHPDFCYLPYLVTGDYFYLEGLLFYFVFMCVSMNPGSAYRAAAKCLWKGNTQVRAQGWSLRTSSHVRYIIPDTHPLKPTVESIYAHNVEYYNAQFVAPNAPQRSVFGHWGGLIYNNPATGVDDSSSAPFQEDFVIQSLGRAIELGFTEWLPMLTYKSALIKGRLTSGTEFCWQAATTYCLQYKPNSTAPEYTTWGEIWQNVWPEYRAAQCGTVEMGIAIGEGLNAMPGYPSNPEGFPANLQPAVAYCATFGMPSGEDAWMVFDARAKKPDYNTAPQFAILPRINLVVQPPEAPIDPPPPPPPLPPVVINGEIAPDVYYGLVGQIMLFGKSQ